MACCVVGCKNHQSINKDISFHVFPHPDREIQRHKQWVKNINNPKFSKLEPIEIYKRMRVCRNHFEPWCLNGACKRLLNTAIPTIYLNGEDIPKICQNSLLKKRKNNETTVTIVKNPRYDIDIDHYDFQSENANDDYEDESDEVVYYGSQHAIDVKDFQTVKEEVVDDTCDYELVEIVEMDDVQHKAEESKFSGKLKFLTKDRSYIDMNLWTNSKFARI